MDVEDEVEELKNNPDVVDIVDTYADLQAYDTQHLTENDIIRVLQDETHNDNSTYYRFTKNPDTWTFIGEISGGGSSVNVVQTTGTSTTDVMSQNAVTDMIYANTASLTNGGIRIGPGSSIASNASRSIAIGPYSSTGTGASYSVALGANATTTRVGEVNVGTGTGTTGYDGTSYRVLGGVHDPVDAHDAATKGYVDANAGGPTVVQTTGTSTVDVMSQNATTSMVFQDPSTQEIVKIGKNSAAGNMRNVSIGCYATAGTGSAGYSVAVGGQAYAPNQDAVALGPTCNAEANGAIAIGRSATVYSGVTNGEAIGYYSKANSGHEYSVAIGAYASTTRAGELNIGTGTTTYGYNSTSYRVLGGVHDPVDAHDAATKGYVDANAGSIIYLAYYPGNEPDPSDVRIYANAALTTELTGGDYWNILASGKPVVLRFNDTSQN